MTGPQPKAVRAGNRPYGLGMWPLSPRTTLVLLGIGIIIGVWLHAWIP